MDIVDAPTRSRMMSGIKAQGTRPELLVRKRLHAKGLRFRLHVPTLPGKPDLVFPQYKTCIFVNGCFWHGHACKIFKMPSSRTAFWQEKFEANKRRDELQIQRLVKLGWRVAVVWECSLRDKENLDRLLADLHDWIVELSSESESAVAQF